MVLKVTDHAANEQELAVVIATVGSRPSPATAARTSTTALMASCLVAASLSDAVSVPVFALA
jgi:hypothetical protein